MRRRADGRSVDGCLLLVVGLTAALSACTADTSGAAVSATGSAVQSPLPSSDPRVAAVLSSYEAYWTAFVGAQDPPNPTSDALIALVSGAELPRAQAAIVARRDAGEVVRGSYGHEDSVVALTDTEAHVQDCLTLHTTVYDATTDAEKRTETPGPFAVDVTMTYTGSAWQVADVAVGTSPCSAAPRPVPSATD